MCSDETKIELFGNKHQRWVWRRWKDRHPEKHLIPTEVWGRIFDVVRHFFFLKALNIFLGYDIIDSIKYQQILNENPTASAMILKMGHGWTFQQDNYSKHTSKCTHKCFTDHRIKVVLWPSPPT